MVRASAQLANLAHDPVLNRPQHGAAVGRYCNRITISICEMPTSSNGSPRAVKPARR